MSQYKVKAVNLFSFDIGEADKVLVAFCEESGPIKALVKGARKATSKMSAKTDLLSVNELILVKGRSFEIVTGVNTIENFSRLRLDLVRLTLGLYFAELTNCFANDLASNSQAYFAFIIDYLYAMVEPANEPLFLAVKFQLELLEFLGYQPELCFCVNCRKVLTDNDLDSFNSALGGIVCKKCSFDAFDLQNFVSTKGYEASIKSDVTCNSLNKRLHITSKVWKVLVLIQQKIDLFSRISSPNEAQSVLKTCLILLKLYLEGLADNRRFRTLDMLDTFLLDTF